MAVKFGLNISRNKDTKVLQRFLKGNLQTLRVSRRHDPEMLFVTVAQTETNYEDSVQQQL
jgi:hypothetical protein